MPDGDAHTNAGAPRSAFDLIGASLPTILTSILAAIGTIGVAFLTGVFDVRKTDAVNQGSITLEKLKFSNDLIKNALASNNPGNSLLFYADIGLLDGLTIAKVREYARAENERLTKGTGGPSVLPSFDKSTRPTFWLDRDFMSAFAPHAKPEVVDALVSTGNYLLLGFGIDASAQRLSLFLGQIAHETAGFTILEEAGSYSKEDLLRRFPKLFDETTVATYVNQPEKILDLIYANRMGNGPESSGDGWKYRGRGFVQLTGRANYERFTKETGVDIATRPDSLSDPHVGLLVAAAFWYYTKLNDLADANDISGITRKITGGLEGIEDRRKYSEAAQNLLAGKLKTP